MARNSSRSGETNALLNLINNEPDVDKIHSYAKDPYKAKYQLLINKRESTGLKYLNVSKAFIEYSNDTDDIYKNYWRIEIKTRNVACIWWYDCWYA